MSTISKSFTATGFGASLAVKHQDSYSYAVSGTFVGTVVLEKSANGGQTFEPLLTFTTAGSGTVMAENKNAGSSLFRFECTAFTSGTIVTSVADVDIVIREFYNDDGQVVFQITEAGITAKAVAVTGFASTDKALARYNGATGILQNSGVIVDDSNNISGVVGIIATGQVALALASVNPAALVAVGSTVQALLTGTSQIGILSSIQSNSSATARSIGLAAEYRTAASSFTCGVGTAIRILTPTIGATSAVTRNGGILFQGIGTSGVSNTAIADNETFLGNTFINQSGTIPSVYAGAPCFTSQAVASAATIAAMASVGKFVRLTGSTATDLQGITAGLFDGQELELANLSGQNLTIRHQSVSASAGNKITTMTGADVVTTGNGYAMFIYDLTNTQWLLKAASL